MRIRNENGVAAIGTAIVLSALGFILISVLQDQTQMFVRESLKNRIRLDIETSIDYFAKDLYSSYILAAAPGDSSPTNVYENSEILPDPTHTKKLYWPKKKKICFEREINAEIPVPICLDRKDGFTLELSPNQLEKIVKKYSSKAPVVASEIDLSWRDWAIITLKSMTDSFRVPEAQADKTDHWNPGLATFGPLNFVLKPDFASPTFIKNYKRYNCASIPADPEDPTLPQFDCITIKFCARIQQGCGPDEFVTQTYIFDRPPKTQLRN